MKYDIEIENYKSVNQICATIKYPCGEVVESWVRPSFVEAAAQVDNWLGDNPPARHEGCIDEYCLDCPITKYEQYALGHYLNDWPEGWSYQKIIHTLKTGDEGFEITACQMYEEMVSEDLAKLIEDMSHYLAFYFAVN